MSKRYCSYCNQDVEFSPPSGRALAHSEPGHVAPTPCPGSGKSTESWPRHYAGRIVGLAVAALIVAAAVWAWRSGAYELLLARLGS